MRTVVAFNHDWLFLPERVGDHAADEQFEQVTLPHTNVILPHHNFDDAEYQFISTYRKRFMLPEKRRGRCVYLDFEGAMLAATIIVNGHNFGEHRGGYTPFSIDITDVIHDDGENLLTVYLDSTERADIPPFGHTVDYMTFGGIYREVSLRLVDTMHIEDVFIRANPSPQVEVDVRLYNQSARDMRVILLSRMNITPDTAIHGESSDITVPPKERVTVTLKYAPEDLQRHMTLWTLDNPHLNTHTVTLSTYDGGGKTSTILDKVESRFGFRSAEFREDGFYLNGEKLQLRGLNRHQMYPYIGAAAPARLQRRDADIVKYALGCNLVRTSHYPQSRHFLDRCDEIGLLVFEEIPGWQHVGDEDWQGLVLRDVRAMIERDRNRPSIVIWGVRINESWDYSELYAETNRLARELDPTRQTGGVRFFMGSEFLEDVFTFNDFSDTIVEPEQTPHLVTEFNGHMFPTKPFDPDPRLVEHAIRHARIQSAAALMGGVSGAIGWCAFDYNTHREFGAGDRICYHGVMDIFRLPKYAAYFYGSQISPQERVVLKIASNWTLGDYNAGIIEPVTVFSNCDEIDVFVGEWNIGKFQPDTAQYPELPHPPFTLSGLGVMLAQPYGDLRVVGYLNGEAVAEHTIAADHMPRALVLEADDTELHADGIDMTRLVFRVVDTYGNTLRYTSGVVTLDLEGDARLIGENPFALNGGQAAVYLKAGRKAGEVIVRARMARFETAEVRIKLV